MPENIKKRKLKRSALESATQAEEDEYFNFADVDDSINARANEHVERHVTETQQSDGGDGRPSKRFKAYDVIENDENNYEESESEEDEDVGDFEVEEKKKCKVEDKDSEEDEELYEEEAEDEDNDESVQNTESEEEEEDEHSRRVKKKRQLDPGEQKIEAEKLARTLFVGNLHAKTHPKHLIQLFNSKEVSGGGGGDGGKADCVESVRLRGALTGGSGGNASKKRAIIQQKGAENNTPIFAFVVLKRADLVERCVAAANGRLLNNFHIRVDRATAKSSERNLEKKNENEGGDVDASQNTSIRNTNCCVFVGNLSLTVNEEAIRAAFVENLGKVVGVRVVRDKATQIGKGFGFVEFEEAVQADFAAKMSGRILIQGRPARIERWMDEKTQQAKRKRKAKKDAQRRGGANSASPATKHNANSDKINKNDNKTKKRNRGKNAQKAAPLVIPSNLPKSQIKEFLNRKKAKAKQRGKTASSQQSAVVTQS